MKECVINKNLPLNAYRRTLTLRIFANTLQKQTTTCSMFSPKRATLRDHEGLCGAQTNLLVRLLHERKLQIRY